MSSTLNQVSSHNIVRQIVNRLYASDANRRYACMHAREPPLTPISPILVLWHRLHSKEREAIARGPPLPYLWREVTVGLTHRSLLK